MNQGGPKKSFSTKRLFFDEFLGISLNRTLKFFERVRRHHGCHVRFNSFRGPLEHLKTEKLFCREIHQVSAFFTISTAFLQIPSHSPSGSSTGHKPQMPRLQRHSGRRFLVSPLSASCSPPPHFIVHLAFAMHAGNKL